MDRPRAMPRMILGFACFAALAAGCATQDEQRTLDRYFAASRLRDNDTLANIATVAFRPSEQGTVQQFDILNVGPEDSRTLRVRELSQAYEEARAADAEFTKRKKEYQDANLEAIERVLKAEREGAAVRGRDADIQKAWAKWREETMQYSGRVSEARNRLEEERGIAQLSVFNPQNPVDLAKFDGQLLSKDVTISASVRTPTGETVERRLAVTLQRLELTGEGGETRSGRWIVTSIRDAEAPPATTS